MSDEVGIVIGEARPDRIEFVAKYPVRVGDYVVVDTEDGPIVYMVEGFRNISELLQNETDYQTADEVRRASSKNPRDRVRIGIARALGLVNELLEGRRIYPTLPPEPGASVKPAGDDLLKSIYGSEGKRWVGVGYLLRRPEVRVSINLNMVASRHLAILAATGKGKSNLLALLAKKVSERHGTMVIFDYHGEYDQLRIPGIKITIPKINPRYLDAEELADLVGVRRDAERQRGLLQQVYTQEVREAEDFWGAIIGRLQAIAVDDNNFDFQTRIRAVSVTEIINRALTVWGKVFDPSARSPLDVIVNNRVNVLDISELTEYQSQIIVDRYLEEILQDRKNAVRGEGGAKFKSPVIVVIEEAHAFLPSERRTRCSEIIARIAREGRKFGVSLIIISQRPSKLDADTISQMGSFAISGLIHPKDQNFVREVTDDVSEELGTSLPSLNPGEMILAGQFIKVPALVKVDLVEEKLIGRDLDAVDLWEREYGSGSDYSTEELIKL
ncbi:hypothetical protein HRbin02_01020 [Candidatus Calditenuaceae archaeon HR02]|nr:hypothetical protein HRbin02_01020 [Candidatus Calditenuaceae archaeon HR02]